MRKRYFFLLVFLFSLSHFYAQENSGIGDAPVLDSESSARIDTSIFFTLGSKIMLNTDDSLKSAPSPVMYSLGIGGDFILKNNIFLQTHGSFFTNYYLWDGERAQPAEVENRTATALSLMLDIDGGYRFKIGKTKKHFVSVGGGIGFLARYAFLSGDVDSSEVNRVTGSTAGDDVSDINSNFYAHLNFFYPEVLLSYSFILSENWKIGAEFRTYIPLGSILNGTGADGMIFSLAAKLSYR